MARVVEQQVEQEHVRTRAPSLLRMPGVIARHDYTKSGATKGSKRAAEALRAEAMHPRTRGWNKLRYHLVDFRVSSKTLAQLWDGSDALHVQAGRPCTTM